MRMHAVGGLCNRLRAIVSYHDKHPDLTVVWHVDEPVAHARFLDVFKPIPGVTFTESGSWDEESFGWYKSAKDGRYGPLEARMMRCIKPTDDIFRRLSDLSIVKPYAAVHVRKTP